MRVLLRANWKVERLERKSPPAIEFAQEVQYDLIGGDSANVFVKLPGVLDTTFAIRLVASGVGEVDAIMRAETGFNTFDPFFQMMIWKTENCIAFFVQIVGDPFFFRVQPHFRFGFGKEGRLN